MPPTLFLQSDMQHPYEAYQMMLAEYPVYWDEENRLWAIYSYAACKAILQNDDAHIPVINAGNTQGLNEHAWVISSHLVRLSNGTAHSIARQIAMCLYEKMKTISISNLIEKLLVPGIAANQTDWVHIICKKLPVLVILKSLDFTEKDTEVVLNNIATLATIMLPHKTPKQVNGINGISKEIYQLVEGHLLRNGLYNAVMQHMGDHCTVGADQLLALCVSNCIGLFIQSYDAGRGILGNTVYQFLNRNIPYNNNKEHISKSVTETLRFDPPIHNTRRVAAHDIVLNQITIKKGDMMLLVLAAANRDPLQFYQPNRYDIERANNHEHLAFGSGAHRCIAHHFAVHLAIECIAFLFNRYPHVQLADQTIAYEPLVNARIPKSMLITLS